MKKFLSLSLVLLLLRSMPIYATERQIFIKTFLHCNMTCGKNICIEINDDATVEDLKKAIEQKEGIPSGKQVIILAGKKLEPKSVLKDLEVQKHATLHLIIRSEPISLPESQKLTDISEPSLTKRFITRFITLQKIGIALTTATLIAIVAGILYKNTKKDSSKNLVKI